MARVFWFAGGFIGAMMLVAALIAGPLMNTRAGDDPMPAPTALFNPTLMPITTPTSVPTPVVLNWQRSGGYSGVLHRLEVVDINQVRYTPDSGGPRVTSLTQPERDTLVMAISRYAPFEYSVRESLDGFSQVAVQIRFNGLGRQVADESTQREMARWAAVVFERLATEEQRSDLVALARLDLAQRTGLAVEAIAPLAISEVTWPNACLDIRAKGMACAQVMTEGCQIQLQAGGTVYEYRTDKHGQVRLAGQPDLATPRPAP